LEIRVKVNTKVQRVMSGTQLRDLNILNGTTYDCTGLPNTAPGVSFPIFFSEPWMVDEQDQDALAWITSDWGSFQIEVDFGAAGTPTLVAYAITDPTKSGGKVNGICKWLRAKVAAQGTSFDWNIPDRRDFLRAISFYPDSGGSNAATLIQFRVAGDLVHELSNTANTAILTQNTMAPAAAGRTTNIYDLVLDHDGLLDSALNLNGISDANVTITAGGAMSGNVVAIQQRIGAPE
jgi:hypothetical protein